MVGEAEGDTRFAGAAVLDAPWPRRGPGSAREPSRSRFIRRSWRLELAAERITVAPDRFAVVDTRSDARRAASRGAPGAEGAIDMLTASGQRGGGVLARHLTAARDA